MKNKYQRLSKEEKKECKKAYYNTLKGKEINIRLTRVNLTGIIGILFSLYLYFNSKSNNSLDVLTIVIMVILSLASIIFLIMSFRLRRKCLNEYAVKNLK